MGKIDNYTMRTAWGTQFTPDGKFPVIDKRIFETLDAAYAYLDYSKADASAIPGLILTVYGDTDASKNGAYFVSEDASSSHNGLELIQLTTGGSLPANLMTGTQYVDGETPTAATGAYANIQGDTTTTIAALEAALTLKSLDENEVLLSETNGVLKSNATLSITKHAESTEEGAAEHDYLQLLGKNGAIVSEVNADAFVKDGMLDSVAWKKDDEGKDTNILVLTWNTDAGKTATEIDMTKFVDAYSGENAINVSDHTISLVISEEESDITLTQDEDGLYASAGDQYKILTYTLTYVDSGRVYTVENVTKTGSNTYKDESGNTWTVDASGLVYDNGTYVGYDGELEPVTTSEATGVYANIQGDTTTTVKELEDALADAGKIDDVQVKTSTDGEYESVVTDKIAQIDLTPYLNGTQAVMADTYTMSYINDSGTTSTISVKKDGNYYYDADDNYYQIDSDGNLLRLKKGETEYEKIGTDASAKQDVTTAATGQYYDIQGNTNVTIEELADRVNNLTTKGGEPNVINAVKGDLDGQSTEGYSDNYVGVTTKMNGTTAEFDVKAQYASFDPSAAEPSLGDGIVDNGVLEAYAKYIVGWEKIGNSTDESGN